mmetsp:Transcript_14945/g.24616  ORF Transcript_14945/g.24616 Transcript_14945/m.24616 type:complete len:311 (+) Transcript_14945:130-1062(+)|eukprot:CAMPEP_0184671306 /NCGR_PEP_ID=MMETSP0308-20130426/85417_1 /TAXON_ID=38269 /ORGANISM="Gloeochaete witrockiana, Strain SAG 46.84" /LENGTH=310 /DNA_ID=CAMNT_0027118397 /DNA_START=111 /DNA_END=1043 /DNA_ORIENTATION=+
MKGRAAARVVTAKKTVEGGGFVVRRAVGGHELPTCDPFLMLDHMGPINYAPGEAVGAPDHPHRGQETISYLLAGEMEHKDSAGHSGVLSTGDVQWMTAGRGVIHSEMPSRKMYEHGGTMEGFQIWVNLPKSEKMCAPRYQDVPSSKIPVAVEQGGKVTVKVVAGEAFGKEGACQTKTPIMYLDFKLLPGAQAFSQPVPEDYEGFVYVYRGKAIFGEEGSSKTISEGQLLVLGAGDALTIKSTPTDECGFLLLAGKPIKEKVVWRGPFVMNTEEEIQQAIKDYHDGKIGKIAGSEERYEQTRRAREKQGGN